jgi:DNA-binding NarL/FixJ family response regulator
MALKNSSVCASSISVYLVAENRLLREALMRLFQNREGMCVVGESGYTRSIGEKIAASQCNVLLLDSETTLATDLIIELNEIAPGTETVMFGMDEDPDSFLWAVRCGARGYVLKDASSAEIIAAVRTVAQGGAICPPKLCRSLFQFVSKVSSERTTTADQQDCVKIPLTYRQRQLVLLVARGMTNKEIAADLNLSEFTVKNHLHRIMKRVQAENRQEAVDVVRSWGVLPVA